MLTFLAVIHIIACFGLVGLVLIQDSKGGGVFSGQSSSNSVLGAGGGATLAQTMTKVVAGIFAVTCVVLSIMSARSDKSVIDSSMPITTTSPATTPATPATNSTAGEKSEATAADKAAPVGQPTK